MIHFSDKGIILKRVDYSEFDLVITLLTESRGKIPIIAKNAKKSKKRFMGILEPFCIINMVCRIPKKGKIPVLMEASGVQLHENIRCDVLRSAYASYWAEMVCLFMEEWKPQNDLFYELCFALNSLDNLSVSPGCASIAFQIRLLSLMGLSPHLRHCCMCNTGIDDMPGGNLFFDLEKGGLVCHRCTRQKKRNGVEISKGTAKILAWIREMPLNASRRSRFSPVSMRQGMFLMELFLTYQLGREPRSLSVLKELRTEFAKL